MEEFEADLNHLKVSHEEGFMSKDSWNECASSICGFISAMIDFKGGDADKVLFWNIAHHVWEDGNLTDKDLYTTLCQKKPSTLTYDEFMLLRMSIHLLRMLPPFEECIDYKGEDDRYVN